MPDAPGRWITRAEAAKYVGLSVVAFSRRVAAGDLPAPSDALGPRCLRWDRLALDSAMGGGIASPVGASTLAAAIIEEARRPNRP
jgi:predicted DNA-binding transcriptional regulator AlpA